MSFQLSNNINNSILQTSEAANKKLLLAIQKLSTGLQLNSASDGAADIALSEKLNSTERSATASINSSKLEQAMTKIAESDLGQISQNNSRIRDLALQSANGVYGDSERSMMQQEVNALNEENNRIASSSSFSDKKLLDGSASGTQVMADQKTPVTVKEGFKNASQASLGIDSVDISNPANALALVDKIDQGQTIINERRAELGSISKTLDSNIERNQIIAENITAANSTIRDTNIAQEMSNLVNAKIMMSAASTMQSAANSTQSSVMGLLRT